MTITANLFWQSQSHTHEFVLSRRGHHWLELNASPGDKTETYAIRIVPTVYTEITSGALCLYLVHDVDVVFRRKKRTRHSLSFVLRLYVLFGTLCNDSSKSIQSWNE